MPFLILVETLTCGKMIPRLSSSPLARYITNVLFFGLAVYAAVYGTSYAYMLHWYVDGIVTWLVLVHFLGSAGSGSRNRSGGATGVGGGWKEMLEAAAAAGGGVSVGDASAAAATTTEKEKEEKRP